MERLEIPFHFWRSVTSKCQYLHNFPLLCTSLPQNSSTKNSQIGKSCIREQHWIYRICTHTHALNISDQPQVSGYEFPLYLAKFMNLFHFRNVIASRKVWQAAGVPVFQGKPENISRMKGSTTVLWTTPRSWLKLKWKSAKKLRKALFYSTRSLLIWFLARPHLQFLCTVRLSHGAQPSWTNQSIALLKYSRNIQEFRNSDTGSWER